MKILFIGTVEFSHKALNKLLDLSAEVVGVCTKQSSPFNSDFKDLTPLCKKANIPYKFVDDINSEKNINWIKHLKPDIIFCFGWSYLIKKELLSLPPLGIIGYHPTKLPQNRGRHPIIWALALGLKQSASTFFFMDEGADSGDILSQKDVDILYEDNAFTLSNKISDIALSQIQNFFPKLCNNTYQRVPQNHTRANIWRKRSHQDGLIDFKMSSRAIYNLIRALSKPYVGAYIEHKGKEIKIWKSKEIIYDMQNIEYGKIIQRNKNSIIVKCQQNAIELMSDELVRHIAKEDYL